MVFFCCVVWSFISSKYPNKSFSHFWSSSLRSSLVIVFLSIVLSIVFFIASNIAFVTCGSKVSIFSLKPEVFLLRTPNSSFVNSFSLAQPCPAIAARSFFSSWKYFFNAPICSLICHSSACNA